MHPGYNHNLWDNCAVILSKKSDEILRPYFSRLLEWIEDLNWPGALTILDRLLRCNIDPFSFDFIECVRTAMATNNQKWLDNLSELLDNKELAAALPEDVLNILQKRYHNPGNW